MDLLTLGILSAVVAAVVAVLYLLGRKRWLFLVPDDRAVVVASALSGRSAVPSGGLALVPPLVARAEQLDLRPIVLELDRRGREGLVFADQEHVDVTARLTLRLESRPTENLLRASRQLGGSCSTDPTALAPFFGPMLSDALKLTAARMGATCLDQRERFCKRTLKALAKDLNGYVLMGLEVEFPGLPGDVRREGPFR
jgi:uncharacterized membrane protein YqiK